MTDSADKVIRIDIDEVLRKRLPAYHRFIPAALIRRLEKYVCQDEMNSLLEANVGRRGVDFCRGVVKELGVGYTVCGELLKYDTRIIVVSNHPLGGLDGMILADMVSGQYDDRSDLRFVVNDLLTFIEPLRDIFIGVNKHGSQSREAAEALDRAFMSDMPIVMFPAGLVSRRHADGTVSDLQWHKMVVNKAVSSRRNIIPVYFDGHNSQFFYKFARFRTRIGLKFNIEMVALPREVFKSAGSNYSIRIGEPIPWQSLRTGKQAQWQADRLREEVYKLK